ncbi:DUF6176 family protein [Frondihabitans sp. Leaf304]|uniref:DUF6176 family protein n=1 Tax=Frondihabitans sp. Leaf304 TaxID=1736329 RepID=UPI001F355BD3|nr:DUF6176 family protein [Frondihabitans sp. Leaf304]
MPSSVPPGMRLELSRAPIKAGQEPVFEKWMSELNARYDELEPALSDERQLFEATFKSTEADGQVWIYHLSLMGSDGTGLDEQHAIAATHAAYSRQAKEPGWEELEPKFMLTPNHIRDTMIRWAATGSH